MTFGDRTSYSEQNTSVPKITTLEEVTKAGDGLLRYHTRSMAGCHLTERYPVVNTRMVLNEQDQQARKSRKIQMSIRSYIVPEGKVAFCSYSYCT